LLTGCGASDPRYHDKVICQRFATAVSVADSPGSHAGGPYGLLARALALGRQEAHRPGYLLPRLARDLRAVTSGDDNKVLRALPAFGADCRAAGVKGRVWLYPYAPSV